MSPIKEFNSLRQRIDKLFDDIIRAEPQLELLSGLGEVGVPAIELQETETEMLLIVQLPGLRLTEIDIQVSDSAVFLAGEHHEQRRDDQKRIFRSEFRYGQFKRVVPLPVVIQREQVKAELSKGLLTLTMLKALPTLPNVIKISVTSLD